MVGVKGTVESNITTIAAGKVNTTTVAVYTVATMPNRSLKLELRDSSHTLYNSKSPFVLFLTIPVCALSHKRRWIIKLFIHRVTLLLIHLECLKGC